MPRGRPKGSGATAAVAPAPTPKKRGGGKRRSAKERLKEAQGKYEKYKAESAQKLADMEMRIATLGQQAAKEETAADIRKRYQDRTADEIEMEYQEALKKVHELKKIRG